MINLKRRKKEKKKKMYDVAEVLMNFETNPGRCSTNLWANVRKRHFTTL